MIDNHYLFHSIHQLSRQLTKHVNEALYPYGLYSAQWAVLYTLKKRGALTQSELCDYLAIEAPPMTRTVQRLVKQGFVNQIPGEDKRTKFIQLTERSINEFPTWEEAILKVNNSLVEQIPSTSQKELSQIITDWLHKIKMQESSRGKTDE